MNSQHQNPSNGHAQGVGARVTEVEESAAQLIDTARSAVEDLAEKIDLRGRTERNPYGMIAAAAGVGYVLGGGLFTPLTGRLIKLGVRLAALPFVKDELIGMAESALDGYTAGVKKSQQ